jgi:hypothetical protein
MKCVQGECKDPEPNEAAQCIETTMWQEQNLCGFLSITTDSSTQRRKNVVVNAWLSNVWGMHVEELLARFASHDLHLHFPALDMLYHMADELVNTHQDRVRYHRLAGLPGHSTGRDGGRFLFVLSRRSPSTPLVDIRGFVVALKLARV